MKLGVLSDTHGLLRQEVLNHLQGCDAILHAVTSTTRGSVFQFDQKTDTMEVCIDYDL